MGKHAQTPRVQAFVPPNVSQAAMRFSAVRLVLGTIFFAGRARRSMRTSSLDPRASAAWSVLPERLMLAAARFHARNSRRRCTGFFRQLGLGETLRSPRL